MKKVFVLLLCLCLLLNCFVLAEESTGSDTFRGIPWLSGADYIRENETEGELVEDEVSEPEGDGIISSWECLWYGHVSIANNIKATVSYWLLDDQLMLAGYGLFYTSLLDEGYGGRADLYNDSDFDRDYRQIESALNYKYGEPNADACQAFLMFCRALENSLQESDIEDYILSGYTTVEAWESDGIAIVLASADGIIEITYIDVRDLAEMLPPQQISTRGL